MLLKQFGKIFDKVIGRLPEEKKITARKIFLELIEVIVGAGAEGFARGISKEIANNGGKQW